MPNLVTLNIGQTTNIPSNPEDANFNPAVPNSPVQWSASGAGITLAPFGILNETCLVTAVTPGTYTVTMSAVNAASATIADTYTVVVNAGLFTQFAPTNTPPA